MRADREKQVLCLYAITDAAQLPGVMPEGLDGQAVELVPLAGMAAAVSGLRNGPPKPGREALQAHFCVTEALMACGTVLPVRFGTVFDGPAGLMAHLEAGHRAYADSLKRLRGHVEVSLRAERSGNGFLDQPAGEVPGLADGGPGARYLAGKRAGAARALARSHEERGLAEYILASLAGHAAETDWRGVPAASGIAVSMAFLLPRERLGAFQDAAGALESCGLELVLSGPWPPYSFAGNLPAAAAP
jgi:hypothetical protein